MEPTSSLDCALYHAQHTTSKTGAAFLRRFRAAICEQASAISLPELQGEQSGHVVLYRDSGR